MAGIIGLLLVYWLVKSIPPKLKESKDEADYIYYFDDIDSSPGYKRGDVEKNHNSDHIPDCDSVDFDDYEEYEG